MFEAGELNAREELSPQWKRAGLVPFYPATAAAAVLLLRTYGIDVDRERVDSLARFDELGMRFHEGRPQWTAVGILAALARLQSMDGSGEPEEPSGVESLVSSPGSHAGA